MYNKKRNVLVAHLDRAIASDAIGSRFESYLRHQIDGETRTFRDNSKTT